jgi:hypothetical protein
MSYTICQESLRAAIRVIFVGALLCGGLRDALRAAEDAPPAPAANLQPVPDAASQAAAIKVLKELFKPYPPTRAEEKVKVAKKLMDQAAASGNDLVTQFVVLHEAAELSAAVGDIQAAMHAIDEIGKHFAIDPGAEKLLILSRAKSVHLNADAASAGADAALQIGADEIHKGDFDGAARAAGLAAGFVRQTQDVKLNLASQTLTNDVRKAQAESARVKTAEVKLKADPADSGANLTVGRFLCFWRGDWTRGLPLLAQGSDAALKSIAAADIAAPKEPAVQFALAEKWLALAGKETGTPRTQIRQHAATWYEQAQAGLGGLQKSLAEKRLAELHETTAPPGSSATTGGHGTWIDLLRMVDPKRDAQAGNWKLENSVLTSNNQNGARVQIPYFPPEEYDYRIVFSRNEGDSAVIQFASRQDREMIWCTGWPKSKFALNEKEVDQSSGLENGRKYTSLIRVRRGSVQFFLNDRLILEEKDQARLFDPGTWYGLQDKRLLGVGSHFSPTSFYSIEIQEVSGHGKLMP